MNSIYGILGLILIGVSALHNLLILTALFSVLFTLRYSAIPLIILAICIDGYFGAYAHVPYFSIAAVIWYPLSELLRARLRINEKV